MTPPFPTVLLVEDDSDFIGILRYVLRPWNPQITVAANATEAAAAAGRRFDLYLIDLHLAGSNASDLLEQLKLEGPEVAERCLIVTSFTRIAPMFSSFRIVDKTKLAAIGEHLLRILGPPGTTLLRSGPKN